MLKDEYHRRGFVTINDGFSLHPRVWQKTQWAPSSSNFCCSSTRCSLSYEGSHSLRWWERALPILTFCMYVTASSIVLGEIWVETLSCWWRTSQNLLHNAGERRLPGSRATWPNKRVFWGWLFTVGMSQVSKHAPGIQCSERCIWMGFPVVLTMRSLLLTTVISCDGGHAVNGSYPALSGSRLSCIICR